MSKDKQMIKPDFKKLSEMYYEPFEKIIKIIKEDRKKAIENYYIYLERLNSGDDANATIEGLNKAMELVIKSTDKLNKLIETSGKLMGDMAKAIGMEKPKEIDLENIDTIKKIRNEGLKDK